jgi:hypothetical protein
MSESNGDSSVKTRTHSQVEWENDVAQFEAPDAVSGVVLCVCVNRLWLPGRPLYSYRIGSYKMSDGKFSIRIPVRIDRKPVQPVVSVVGINAALFVDLFRQADAWVIEDCKGRMEPDDLLTLQEKRDRVKRERDDAAAQAAALAPVLRKAAR